MKKTPARIYYTLHILYSYIECLFNAFSELNLMENVNGGVFVHFQYLILLRSVYVGFSQHVYHPQQAPYHAVMVLSVSSSVRK